MRILIAALLALAVNPGDAAPSNGSAVMTWSRTGGIAGVRETLRIGIDRRTVADDNGRRITGRLGRRHYARLRRILDEARLGSIDDPQGYPVADAFVYAVGYRGDRVVLDETDDVPERLRRALAELSRVFENLRHRPALVDPQHAALNAARARWRDAGLRSYRFRLEVSCYCPDAGVERVIRVRDGRPQGGKGADRSVDTVPEMFRQIRDALDNPDAGDVEVRYDAELGYPRAASLDRIKMAIDDEISWTARGLRALPAG